MKNRALNLFELKYIQNNLIITFITIFCISCEKENPTVYSFVDYSFTESIECYDTLGNQFDSLSYMFSEVDFIYDDEFHIPYKKIEIIEDNTFIINYSSDGKSETLSGIINWENDSVYFYVNKINPNNLLLEGSLIDNQLKIAGCGYIYYTYIEDGLIYKEKNRITTLKIPDIESLLDDFPNPQVNNNRIIIKYLYFQRFDLLYEKTSE